MNILKGNVTQRISSTLLPKRLWKELELKINLGEGTEFERVLTCWYEYSLVTWMR